MQHLEPRSVVVVAHPRTVRHEEVDVPVPVVIDPGCTAAVALGDVPPARIARDADDVESGFRGDVDEGEVGGLDLVRPDVRAVAGRHARGSEEEGGAQAGGVHAGGD